MDDEQFQSWMRRMAAVDEAGRPASANAIWWRAQLRRRLDAEERATRPIRIAECAAGVLSWILAAAFAAGLGTGGFVAFLALSLAFAGGLRAIALKRI
jgi:hypothetical protein